MAEEWLLCGWGCDVALEEVQQVGSSLLAMSALMPMSDWGLKFWHQHHRCFFVFETDGTERFPYVNMLDAYERTKR